ncbi:hypothetical protein AJ80_00739 [Polytolypa hystricis UAMH7299]|uniref:Carboxypeptidase n=1 Tax=Polytolypa hystricis (strain UAMH7299) TaxID=1447883 RepID=A0A2B7Z2Z6_POLH7|nr:hypothetical protein AJ80_00739 [Polytolypa hystricis UAMH7299]
MILAIVLALVAFAYAVPSPVVSRNASLNASQFEVKSLPGANFLSPSWAGLILVFGTADGNSLFFWLFEAENRAYDDNLVIWLNGGPGCSSLIGFFLENGPTKLGHALYVDQPVGSGFSTASQPNPVNNNERITSDFYSWLKAFYQVFPHLLEKKMHLMGESYAGVYLPYFASRIMENHDSLAVNLTSISIGNGILDNNTAMTDVTVGSFMKLNAERLGMPQNILDTFSAADRTCGFDSVLEQGSKYPPPQAPINILGNPEHLNFKRQAHGNKLSARRFGPEAECDLKPNTSAAVTSSILNSTCYGSCATFSTAGDYLDTLSESRGDIWFNFYNINYNCTAIDPTAKLTTYLNRADVQKALNVPQYSRRNGTYPFQSCNHKLIQSLTPPYSQSEPPAYSVLPTLISKHKIPVHIYHGALDMLVNHVGAELVLQNMTWNGQQGFQQRPNKPFGTMTTTTTQISPRWRGERKWATAADEKNNTRPAAGVWTEERGLLYHLFHEAGHGVPMDQPEHMFNYVRDVVVGRT